MLYLKVDQTVVVDCDVPVNCGNAALDARMKQRQNEVLVRERENDAGERFVAKFSLRPRNLEEAQANVTQTSGVIALLFLLFRQQARQ